METISKPSLLRDTALLYKELSEMNYSMILENGQVIELRFPTKSYHHLVGLHKYTDIAEVTVNKQMGRSQVSIFNNILRGKITEYDLQTSAHYTDETADRLRSFLNVKALLSNQATIIPDFDINKVPFNTKIESDLLLFRTVVETTVGTIYMHLFFIYDEHYNFYAPVTFFENYSDAYIKNQRTLAIQEVKVEKKHKSK